MPDFEPAAPNPRPSDATDMVTRPNADFIVKFWGVRDQVSVPGEDTIRYGGNTSCVEIRVGEKRLIFDGGSGLRVLGNHLLASMPTEAYLFFTHCHWDSIQGFPFFTPAFIPGNCFRLYGSAASDGTSLEQRLSYQMLAPNFPVPLQLMRSELKFYDLNGKTKVVLDDVTVETISLNYAHRATGYRVTWQGHSVVYATDRTGYQDHLDPDLLHLSRQADLLILDAPHAISVDDTIKSDALRWQDDLWQTGIATAKAAEVKQIVISRYSPEHDDNFLDRVKEQVQSVLPDCLLASEGMILRVHC